MTYDYSLARRITHLLLRPWLQLIGSFSDTNQPSNIFYPAGDSSPLPLVFFIILIFHASLPLPIPVFFSCAYTSLESSHPSNFQSEYFILMDQERIFFTMLLSLASAWDNMTHQSRHGWQPSSVLSIWQQQYGGVSIFYTREPRKYQEICVCCKCSRFLSFLHPSDCWSSSGKMSFCVIFLPVSCHNLSILHYTFCSLHSPQHSVLFVL